jgi:5-methylcytosine-specific restriction endonuclease McrA
LTPYCKACSAARAKKQYWENKSLRERKLAYKRSNVDKYNALDAKRRAKKFNATPSWLSQEQLEEIECFYSTARAFKMYTGEAYCVDHIIPLQGEMVSGLHVPWNLQVLTEADNISKKNKLFLEKEMMW